MNRNSIAVSAAAIALTLVFVGFVAVENRPQDKRDDVVRSETRKSANSFQIPDHFIQQAHRAAARERRTVTNLQRRRPKGLEDLSDQSAIDRVIEQAIATYREPDYDRQRQPSHQLRYLGDRAFSALVKGAWSDHPQTAINCGGKLEYFGARGAEQLVDVARNHSNPTIRSHAISNLSQTHQPAAIPVLVELLEDESAQVRNAAAGSLPWFRDNQVIPALKQATKDPRTGNSAERALEELRNPTWVPSWPRELLGFKQLCNDASTIKGEVFGRKEIDTIVGYLGHKNSTVAGAAMLALRKLDPRATLAHILANSSAPYRITVLASIPEREAVDVVIDFVESASDTHNGVWLQRLRSGGRWIVPLLIAALDDDRLWVPGYDEVDDFGTYQVKTRLPGRHQAHSTLWGLLYQLGLKGETINLYNHSGEFSSAGREIARLRVWWKDNGDAFLAGADVPNPKLTNVIYFDP